MAARPDSNHLVNAGEVATGSQWGAWNFGGIILLHFGGAPAESMRQRIQSISLVER